MIKYVSTLGGVDMIKTVFMGTPEFACGILNTLLDMDEIEVIGVVSQPDKKVGRKQVLQMTPVKKLALEHDLPVFQPERIKTDYQTLLDWNPDLVVTCAYGQLVPKIVLESFVYGCINVHASLLPKYRGGSPMHTAILNGETETGVTIMRMVQRMDAGEMYHVRKVAIDPDDTTEILHDKLMECGALALRESLVDVCAGKRKGIAQDESKVTYAWNITKQQELIGFDEDYETTVNHIRGLISWPVGYTYLEGKKVKLHGVRRTNRYSNKEDGTIVGLSSDGLDVALKGRILAITSLQMEGKGKVSAKEFMNGTGRNSVGKKFTGVNESL